MAIVRCPECGKEISSKASVCVHCGCKLIVCPECGQVNFADCSVCPNCGRKLTDSEAEKKESEYKQSGKRFRAGWAAENPVQSAAAKGILVGIFLIFFVLAALIATGAVMLHSWTGDIKKAGVSDALEALLNVGRLENTLDSLIIAACVFAAAMKIVSSLHECYLPACWKKWIVNKRYVAKDFIVLLQSTESLDAGTNEGEKIKEEEAKLKTAFYWSVFPEEFTKAVWSRVVSCVLWVAAAVFLGVALHENLEEYLSALLEGRAYSLQYLSLLIAAGLIVAAEVFQAISSAAAKRKIEKWAR